MDFKIGSISNLYVFDRDGRLGDGVSVQIKFGIKIVSSCS